MSDLYTSIVVFIFENIKLLSGCLLVAVWLEVGRESPKAPVLDIAILGFGLYLILSTIDRVTKSGHES